MTTTTAARFKSTPTDNLDAKLEAALNVAARDFERTTGLTDGTRSAQVALWTAELERVCEGAA